MNEYLPLGANLDERVGTILLLSSHLLKETSDDSRLTLHFIYIWPSLDKQLRRG